MKGKLSTVCAFYTQLFKGNLWLKLHNEIVFMMLQSFKGLQGIGSTT